MFLKTYLNSLKEYIQMKDLETRQLILGSDFENFQIDVSYNAMSSRQKIIEKHEN